MKISINISILKTSIVVLFVDKKSNANY